ncbi:hypothetical protein OAL15_01215 [Flavobacteriales bacterium]|nr:hypothetical protein [Flavobacteriales bacterium]
MSRVILQPCANKDAREHYNDTIKTSVKLDKIRPHVSKEEFDTLCEIYPNGDCRVWGVTPGGSNQTRWNRIERGDVTLFSQGGHIFASATTTYKLHSHSLAVQLWDYDNKGQTWEYVYFLDEIKSHRIPYEQFNKAAGYKDNYVIQGFGVLEVGKSANILATFNLESEVFLQEVTEQEYVTAINRIEELKETETTILSTRRLEQGYLKKILFGNKTIGVCACCKKEFPTSYLVTAHIKKRSACTLSEKKDPSIVMPMCKLGCDELYERGYISVSNAHFVDMEKKPNSPSLQNHIEMVKGEKCEYHNDKTKAYFDWHFNTSQ